MNAISIIRTISKQSKVVYVIKSLITKIILNIGVRRDNCHKNVKTIVDSGARHHSENCALLEHERMIMLLYSSEKTCIIDYLTPGNRIPKYINTIKM